MQPSSIVSCLVVNFQFTKSVRVKNRKLQTRTPRWQGPEEKTHPFFQFRVQAQKHPFFRFRVQAHENNPFFRFRVHFMFANMLKKRPLFTRNLERSCVHEVNREWRGRGSTRLHQVQATSIIMIMPVYCNAHNKITLIIK